MGERLSKNHLRGIISNSMSIVMDENDGEESSTENESHANMVVVGKHVTILSDTGNKVDVRLFVTDYQAMEFSSCSS